MKRFAFTAMLAVLAAHPAWSQDDAAPEPPPAPLAAESVPLRPAPPAGSFGVWTGTLPGDNKPMPKGLEPFYVKQEWNRTLGDAPVFAFAMVGMNLLTWEGTRDKKTRAADYSTTDLRYRRSDKEEWNADEVVQTVGRTEDTANPPRATLIALDTKKDYFLWSQQLGEGKNEFTHLLMGSPGTMKTQVIPRTPSIELPLTLLEYPRPDQPRYLAQAKTGVAIMEFKPVSEVAKVTSLVEPTVTKSIPLAVRVAPVSAACVAEFAGDRKQIVAALGSVNNSPVAFAGLRGKGSLPDTEDEFAPGILAAWNVPGRALPFLVAARNVGADEGTDNPEGRVVLSLWNAAENRWQAVWESPAMGRKIVGVATQGGNATTRPRLFAVYEEASGTARIACLTPQTIP